VVSGLKYKTSALLNRLSPSACSSTRRRGVYANRALDGTKRSHFTRLVSHQTATHIIYNNASTRNGIALLGCGHSQAYTLRAGHLCVRLYMNSISALIYAAQRVKTHPGSACAVKAFTTAISDPVLNVVSVSRDSCCLSMYRQ
jgi:hypothetical protein